MFLPLPLSFSKFLNNEQPSSRETIKNVKRHVGETWEKYELRIARIKALKRVTRIRKSTAPSHHVQWWRSWVTKHYIFEWCVQRKVKNRLLLSLYPIRISLIYTRLLICLETKYFLKNDVKHITQRFKDIKMHVNSQQGKETTTSSSCLCVCHHGNQSAIQLSWEELMSAATESQCMLGT